MVDETALRVRRIVSEQLQVAESDVTAEASFRDDLGADSLDEVELVMAFEEEFDLDIPDDDALGIRTVGDALADVEGQAAVAPAP